MYYKAAFIVCLLLLVAQTKGADVKVKDVAIDIGKNLTLKCPIRHANDVMWIREGREDQQVSRMTILENGTLFISKVDRNDSGVYVCSRQNVVTDTQARIKLKVRTPPPPLWNVSVRPSTILALILWEVKGNGGYPIINFTAQYRLAFTDDDWMPISPNHITPNVRQIEVYKLQPNTSYVFRIWATNQLGRGEITEAIGTTLNRYQEQELARRLLDGAESFDTRVWAVAVGVVMGTLVLLGFGTCFMLYQECQLPGGKVYKFVKRLQMREFFVYRKVTEEQEVIELVPNIILNPGFEANQQVQPDENSNSETPERLNNNTVVQPRNM